MSELINQTDSGYGKYEQSDGTTVYRDPQGRFTSQQAYAAAVGNEQSEYERDENGRITSREIIEDEDGPEDEPEDEREPRVEDFDGVFRSILYAGTDYRPSQTRVELAVWIIQETPDANVSVDDLQRTWWDRAKGIAFSEIGPVVGEISDIPNGIEENERIDRDEVRSIDRPLGKVHAAVLVERGFGSYGYKVDFSRGTLERDDRYATLAPAISNP